MFLNLHRSLNNHVRSFWLALAVRSFATLGEEGGAGAATQLAIGISEALYNTALGIAVSSLALIMYNIFTTKIDSITYGIDESGFTLTQSFASQYK